MNYDTLACIHQLASQIYNLSHVAHHVYDAMYFCANNNIHHYQPACDWLKSHNAETTEETYDNPETATQIYYLCQSIINTWPYAKLVLAPIEYCALCKCTPAIHWSTGYWTCYISCVMSNPDPDQSAGSKIKCDLKEYANTNHPIMAILLSQVVRQKAKRLNGFTPELLKQITCPWFQTDEKGTHCSFSMDETWTEETEPCIFNGNIYACDPVWKSILTCDDVTKQWSQWSTPSILFHPTQTWKAAIASIPTELVTLDAKPTKDWLDGYCACYLNYYSSYNARLNRFQNNEYILAILSLNRFNAPNDLKQIAEESFSKGT